jgi:hypothetical protein
MASTTNATCPDCGGLIIGGFAPLPPTTRHAALSGFERPIRYCEECSLEVDDDTR